MSLSNTIKTNILDPFYFSQSRCEWRLPADKVLLQNLRLGDFGVRCDKDNVPLNYASNVGAYQLIKNIFLFHNNQVICQLKDADHVMAFQNLLNTNEANANKATYVTKNNWGFQFNSSSRKIELNSNVPESTISDSVNNSALLSISRMFPYLEQAGYLNTAEMRQLRLVIDFNSLSPTELNFKPQIPTGATRANPCVLTFGSDASALGFAVGQTLTAENFDGNGWDAFNSLNVQVTVVAGNNVTVNTDTSGGAYTGAPTQMGGIIITNFNNAVSLSVNQPTLLVDEIINPNWSGFKVRPVAYTALELETVDVGQDVMGVSTKLNAWNNKNLNRLLMVNRPISSTDQGVRKYQSMSAYDERFQFYVNGEQLVPNQGINNPGLKEMYLIHAWGDGINVPQGSKDIRNVLNNDQLFEESPSASVQNSNLAGNLSYGGVVVGKNIFRSLDMEYSRLEYPLAQDAGLNVASVQPFTLAIYGEVSKVVEMNGNSVVVMG